MPGTHIDKTRCSLLQASPSIRRRFPTLIPSSRRSTYVYHILSRIELPTSGSYRSRTPLRGNRSLVPAQASSHFLGDSFLNCLIVCSSAIILDEHGVLFGEALQSLKLPSRLRRLCRRTFPLAPVVSYANRLCAPRSGIQLLDRFCLRSSPPRHGNGPPDLSVRGRRRTPLAAETCAVLINHPRWMCCMTSKGLDQERGTHLSIGSIKMSIPPTDAQRTNLLPLPFFASPAHPLPASPLPPCSRILRYTRRPGPTTISEF